MADQKDPKYWLQRRDSLTKLKDELNKARQYVQNMPSNGDAPAQTDGNRGQLGTGLPRDAARPPIGAAGTMTRRDRMTNNDRPYVGASNGALMPGRNTNRMAQLPPRTNRNGFTTRGNVNPNANGLQNGAERSIFDATRALSAGGRPVKRTEREWRPYSPPLGTGLGGPYSFGSASTIGSPLSSNGTVNSLYKADPNRFALEPGPSTSLPVPRKHVRRHRGDMLGIKALQQQLPEELRAVSFGQFAPFGVDVGPPKMQDKGVDVKPYQDASTDPPDLNPNPSNTLTNTKPPTNANQASTLTTNAPAYAAPQRQAQPLAAPDVEKKGDTPEKQVGAVREADATTSEDPRRRARQSLPSDAAAPREPRQSRFAPLTPDSQEGGLALQSASTRQMPVPGSLRSLLGAEPQQFPQEQTQPLYDPQPQPYSDSQSQPYDDAQSQPHDDPQSQSQPYYDPQSQPYDDRQPQPRLLPQSYARAAPPYDLSGMAYRRPFDVSRYDRMDALMSPTLERRGGDFNAMQNDQVDFSRPLGLLRSQEVNSPQYRNYLHGRYPHILNDALIPGPSTSMPGGLPSASRRGSSPRSSEVQSEQQPPPQAQAQTQSGNAPVQNVYVNTVTNNAGNRRNRSRSRSRSRSPRYKFEVTEYVDELVDQDLSQNLLPALLNESMEELRLRDDRDRLRWERLKFHFNHDDDCNQGFIDAFIASAIEEMLPQLFSEMVGSGGNWLLDKEEIEARAILDDLLSIDLTLIVQSLCREVMNELVGLHLLQNRFQLSFSDVLALDSFDRMLIEAVRQVVRDSLEDLIFAERQRHIAYEFYKEMLNEIIRDIQDSVIAETLFEVAIMDPVLEDMVLDKVVGEEAAKVVLDVMNELSMSGVKQLESDVRKDYGSRLIDSVALDYLLGGFAMQGMVRVNSEPIDRAFNSLLFGELFATLLDINRCHRNTLQNSATKFAYDKIFGGLATESLLERLVEETDQNLCDADYDEVDQAELAIFQDMDQYLFGVPDRYRSARAAAEMAPLGLPMSNRLGTAGPNDATNRAIPNNGRNNGPNQNVRPNNAPNPTARPNNPPNPTARPNNPPNPNVRPNNAPNPNLGRNIVPNPNTGRNNVPNQNNTATRPINQGNNPPNRTGRV